MSGIIPPRDYYTKKIKRREILCGLLFLSVLALSFLLALDALAGGLHGGPGLGAENPSGSTSNLKVDSSGNLFVILSGNNPGGATTFQYTNATTDLASNTTATYSTQITGSALRLKQLVASSSGLIRALFQTCTDAGLTICTQIAPIEFNQTGSTIKHLFAVDIDVAVGVYLVARILNREADPQNVYFYAEGIQP